MRLTRITSFTGEFRFLSNFYPCAVEWEGYTYTSTEAAYQAAKTVSTVDREMIRAARTPAEAKRLGRRVTLRLDWDQVRIPVMRELLQRKFADPTLRQRLQATAPAELIEGNRWGDKFWGAVYHPAGEWRGENHLGKLLMALRDAESVSRAASEER